MMTLDDEITLLGEFASKCEVYSLDPYLSDTQVEILRERGDRYRALQVAAMLDEKEMLCA